jgi:hypothetical protein
MEKKRAHRGGSWEKPKAQACPPIVGGVESLQKIHPPHSYWLTSDFLIILIDHRHFTLFFFVFHPPFHDQPARQRMLLYRVVLFCGVVIFRASIYCSS